MQERDKNLIEARNPAQYTQNSMNQIGSRFTQSTKVIQSHVEGSQENRSESKWGQFLIPIINNHTSHSDED